MVAKNNKLTIGFLETHTQLEEQHRRQILNVVPSATIRISTPETVVRDAAAFDILLSFRLPDEVLKSAKNLKWFHALSVGVNTLVPKLKDTAILLTNSSGVHPIPIAEHVFGMLLLLTRKLDQALLAQKQKEWKSFRNNELAEINGKTMLILGYGAIGEQLGKIGKAFGMTVIGAKRKKAQALYADKIITNNELPKFIPTADVVVIALPATKDTFHFVDAKFLKQMKEPSILVNIGRGDIIDEQALIKTLKTKNMTALLDVFEQEPLPASNPLWGMDNVFITAHYAGATPKYMDRAITIFCKNLEAYLKKKPMPNLVDKRLGY